MSAYQEAAKWISLDWLSLGKSVIKWGSFNKTDFFYKNNLNENDWSILFVKNLKGNLRPK